MLPHARRDNLLIREIGDDVVVYDLERDRAHCLTPTAAMIWRLCDGEKTVAELARRLEQELNTKLDDKVVWLVLNRLEQAHLLRERLLRPREIAGISRRQAISLGLAGAASLLLNACGVDSVTAPTATPPAANPAPSTTSLTLLEPPTRGPRCCRYAGPAILIQDCAKDLVCPGAGLPIKTDIRCDTKDCPPIVTITRNCRTKKGHPAAAGRKCTFTVAGPACEEGC